jgi:hypothetical protein
MVEHAYILDKMMIPDASTFAIRGEAKSRCMVTNTPLLHFFLSRGTRQNV